ncbi:hypothetical protein A6A04_05610 [Paramagnetospirillum marisnigri]|uniref:Uncharacterized protein n=2 Tax=Paramagnetospirillum marisnigri TaxID=1285242 RepID=A0A178MCR1_9PROT|nr:hypothetical protein A6A04_05610 [Paramagnetospirillum marisnigri]
MAALAACSNANEETLGRLQPGRTTVEAAVAALGSPDRDEALADGSRMLTYTDVIALPRPATFAPGLVYAWGGWKVTNNEAGLMFGPDGLLRFWSWSTNRNPSIKVVGRDVVPHPGLDPEHDPKNQDPHPENGTGASRSYGNPAN